MLPSHNKDKFDVHIQQQVTSSWPSHLQRGTSGLTPTEQGMSLWGLQQILLNASATHQVCVAYDVEARS